MRRRLVLLGRVTAETDLPPGRAELEAVRVMAVGARHAPMEHLALEKRAVLVHLVPDLPIGVVEAILENRHPVGVAQRPAVHVLVRELAAPRVASSAHLDLAPCAARRRSLRIARLCADRPRDPLAFVQRDAEPLRPAVEPLPVALLPCPRNVGRTRSMAGLTGDIDLGVGGGEAPGLRIVALPHARRVALGAHVVPVLAPGRPVQLVRVSHVLPRIEVKPALAALRLGARVPGDAERLEAPIGKLDEVLLERGHAERVLDIVVVQLAVGAIGPHHELAALAREGRRDAAVGEPGIVEVTGDAGLGRRLHGEIVVRSPPALLSLLVALPAHLLPDIARCRARRLDPASHRRLRLAARRPPPRDGRDGEDSGHAGTQQERLESTTRSRRQRHRPIGPAAWRARRHFLGLRRLPPLPLTPTHCPIQFYAAGSSR